MEKKKKILRVITRLEKGGVPYEVVKVMRSEEINKKFEQVLVAGYTPDEIPIPPDVKIRRVKNFSREIDFIKDLKALFELIKIVKEEKPFIIHAHTSKAGFLARIAGKICGTPKIIYSPHGHVFYGYFSRTKTLFFKFIEFIASFFTDYIVVRTEEEKAEFQKIGCRTNFFQIPKSPIKDTANQSQIEEKSEEIIKKLTPLKRKNIKIIGTVSRLEPVKGVGYLVRAFPLINSEIKNSFLLIVGDGSEKEKLEKLAREKIEEGKFLFTGWLENLDKIYPLFDVFVVPSLNEAWGATILEAGKYKIPIIATDVGGIPYFAGGYVKLIPPKNEEKIKSAVVEILLNPELKKILSEKSFELSKKYTEELMIQKYLELYEKVTSET